MQLRHIVAIGTPLNNIQKAKSKEVLRKPLFQLHAPPCLVMILYVNNKYSYECSEDTLMQ